MVVDVTMMNNKGVVRKGADRGVAPTCKEYPPVSPPM